MKNIFAILFIVLSASSSVVNAQQLKHHHGPVFGSIFMLSKFIEKSIIQPNLKHPDTFEHDLKARRARIKDLERQISELGCGVLTSRDAEVLAALEEELEELLNLGNQPVLIEEPSTIFSEANTGTALDSKTCAQALLVPGIRTAPTVTEKEVYDIMKAVTDALLRELSPEDDSGVTPEEPNQTSSRASRNVTPPEELELDAHRIAQRKKQIAMGIISIGYKNYRFAVPVYMRQPGNPNHPVAPNPNLRWSKRVFDVVLAEWRRALHLWDNPPTDRYCQWGELTLGDLGLAEIDLHADLHLAEEEIAAAKTICDESCKKVDSESSLDTEL